MILAWGGRVARSMDNVKKIALLLAATEPKSEWGEWDSRHKIRGDREWSFEGSDIEGKAAREVGANEFQSRG